VGYGAKGVDPPWRSFARHPWLPATLAPGLSLEREEGYFASLASGAFAIDSFIDNTSDSTLCGRAGRRK